MPGPQRIADILTQLMARRGFARVQGAEAYQSAWNEAAGPLAAMRAALTTVPAPARM